MEKVCTKCKLLKPLSEFHKDSKMKDGKKSSCKKCCNKAQVKYKDRIRTALGKKKQAHFQDHPIQNGKKRCPKCTLWKPMTPEYFYRNKYDKYGGGFCAYCKDCSKALQKINIIKYAKKIAKIKRDWTKRNREHVRKHKKEYYHTRYKWTHIGVIRAKSRRSYKRHTDKRLAYNRAHPEERLKISLKWRAKNPEKYKCHQILNWALRNGIIRKPNKCSRCPKKITDKKYLHGHHEDYSSPLKVVWVCNQCHCNIHREKREKREKKLYAEMVKLKIIPERNLLF
jgi:hypothetical protein